jgi:hypothetical protein
MSYERPQRHATRGGGAGRRGPLPAAAVVQARHADASTVIPAVCAVMSGSRAARDVPIAALADPPLTAVHQQNLESAQWARGASIAHMASVPMGSLTVSYRSSNV